MILNTWVKLDIKINNKQRNIVSIKIKGNKEVK